MDNLGWAKRSIGDSLGRGREQPQMGVVHERVVHGNGSISDVNLSDVDLFAGDARSMILIKLCPCVVLQLVILASFLACSRSYVVCI